VQEELPTTSDQPAPKPRRVIFGVGLKLIGLIAVLLISSVVSLVWISTRIFNENLSNMIQQTNSDTAFGVATQIRELLQNSMEKSRTIGILMHQGKAEVIEKNPIVEDLFTKDPDFYAVYLHQTVDGKTELKGKELWTAILFPVLL